MQCHPPHACPWDHCSCFCSPVPPCAAGRNLLGRCLCGSFCPAATCVAFLQSPMLTLVIVGLMRTSFGSSGLSFALQSSCVLLLGSRVCTLCCPLCWLCLSVVPHLATWAHPLCCKGCVCWLGLYAMPLCGIPSPPSVWVHGPGAVNGLRSAAISVYGLPNPCFAWFSETSQLLFRPACEGFPFVWEPCRFRVHSLPWGTNSCPEVLCPLSRSSPSFPF